ncbi:MAG TPA: Stk1 family PASTA domain-containing Ser/Thr kinase [Solirubrobacteraceae bacterium]|nr:Stk1 family PASTA domain-containing Ser/Thr kinase [Solirubrobacteraceae bacterium]
MVEANTVIDGRYRVLSRIGSGGMADVYLARDQLLGREVAVKLLHDRFAEDQEFVERFKREASSAAGLSHPNVVGIFDRGEWNGTYYIAMEYVPGRSLKAIVREQGALEPALAINIVTQILRAARFAHRRGVIHRDLKPHNVILDEEGRAKVTDFGIARAGASDMTLTGSIMGTAQYLSPEQAQGHAVSGSSDLYAIGVVLYELLTGSIPFDGETAVTIALKQVSAEPVPPSTLNPAIPPALDAVVLCALTKDPAKRFADADQFITALEQAARELPAAGSGAQMASGDAPALGAAGVAAPFAVGRAQDEHAAAGPPTGGLLIAAAELPNGGEEERARRRRNAWIAALVVTLAAIAVVLALVLPAHNQVTVPSVAGESRAQAVATLRQAGLKPLTTASSSGSVPSGSAIGTTPPGGSSVKRGSRVTVTVSSGPNVVTLPDVAGLKRAAAVAKLQQSGFQTTAQSQPSATVAKGRAVSTDPLAGAKLAAGSAVTVFVSSGPKLVKVPDLVGQAQADATTTLVAAGLKLGTVTQQVSASKDAGTVLAQTPAAGAQLATGRGVNIVVAQQPQDVAVPGLVGQSEAQAAAALGGAGFVPQVAAKVVTDPTQVGVVLKQSPAAGRRAKRGATVTITVGSVDQQSTTPTSTTPTTTGTTTATTTTPPPAGAVGG